MEYTDGSLPLKPRITMLLSELAGQRLAEKTRAGLAIDAIGKREGPRSDSGRGTASDA